MAAATILVVCMAALNSSCSKEEFYTETDQEAQTGACTVEQWRLEVGNQTMTRTTAGEDLKVKFQQGDRLWCVAKDTYGIIAGIGYLTLESGEGTNKAIFTGEYAYKTGATIKEYNFMLLSANTEAYEIKKVADRTLSWVSAEVRQWPFPATDPLPTKICPDLKDAVERFGVFSCKVEAENAPKSITLSQEKSFISFNLTLKINTGLLPKCDIELTCHYTDKNGITRMLPTSNITTGPDKGSGQEFPASFVLAMDNSFSKAQIIIPRESESALAVKFGKAENNLEPGTVYSVSKTIDKESKLWLEKDMPTGFIGMCTGDVEGIIVDLGRELGRIVVDTKNLGSVRPEDPGQMCGWGDTYDMGNGWKALDREKFDALLNLEHTWKNPGDVNGVEFSFELQGFNISNTLFLPAAGYMFQGQILEKGLVGFYWTSSCTDWEQTDAFVMEFAEAGHQLVTSSVRGQVYSVRRYHTIDDI